jgi:hypothetical protein
VAILKTFMLAFQLSTKKDNKKDSSFKKDSSVKEAFLWEAEVGRS